MEELKEQWLNTKFGRLLITLIIDLSAFFIINSIYQNTKNPSDFLGFLYWFAIAGLSNSLLIFLLVDTFGPVDELFNGTFGIFMGVGIHTIFWNGVIFLFFLCDITVIPITIFDVRYIPDDPFTIAMYFTCVMFCIVFFVAFFVLQERTYLIGFITIIAFVVTFAVGLLWGFLVKSSDSKFLIFWIPVILAAISYFFIIKFLLDEDFPDIDAEDFELSEFCYPLWLLLKYLGLGLFYLFKYLGIGLFYLFKYLFYFIYILFKKLFIWISNIKAKKKNKPVQKEKKQPTKQLVVNEPIKEELNEENDEPDFTVSKVMLRLSGRLVFFVKTCFGWHLYNGESKTVLFQLNPRREVRNIFVKTYYFRRVKGFNRNIVFRITETISNILDCLRTFIESIWEIVLVACFITTTMGIPFILIALFALYGLIILFALLGRLERKIFKIDNEWKALNDKLSGGDGEAEYDYKYTFKGPLGLIKYAYLKCFGYIKNFGYEMYAKTFISNADEVRKAERERNRKEERITYQYQQDVKDIAARIQSEYDCIKQTYIEQLSNDNISAREFAQKMRSLDEDKTKQLDNELRERENKYKEDLKDAGGEIKSEIRHLGTAKIAKIRQMIRPKYYTTSIWFKINELVTNFLYSMLLPLLGIAIYEYTEKYYFTIFIFIICLIFTIIGCLISLLLRKKKNIDALAWSLATQNKIKEKEAARAEKMAERAIIKPFEIILLCIPGVNLLFQIVYSFLTLIGYLPYRKYLKLQLIGYVPLGITVALITFIIYYFLGGF